MLYVAALTILGLATVVLAALLWRTVGTLRETTDVLEEATIALMDASERMDLYEAAIEASRTANVHNLEMLKHIAEQTGADIEFDAVTVN